MSSLAFFNLLVLQFVDFVVMLFSWTEHKPQKMGIITRVKDIENDSYIHKKEETKEKKHTGSPSFKPIFVP